MSIHKNSTYLRLRKEEIFNLDILDYNHLNDKLSDSFERLNKDILYFRCPTKGLVLGIIYHVFLGKKKTNLIAVASALKERKILFYKLLSSSHSKKTLLISYMEPFEAISYLDKIHPTDLLYQINKFM